jgi:hypothetical protein
MRIALEQQPEFSIWNLAVANTQESAEVTIEVTRPFMTFDWQYNMIHQKTGIVLGSGKVVAWDGKAAAPKIAADIVRKIKAARPMPLEADPTQLLQTFRTLFIHSDTIYLKAEEMQQCVDRRPEFSAWGLSAVKTQETADVVIEVTRPFLTFDWKYNIIHRKTAVGLGSGKVVAWDGKTAAPQLTAEIIKQIQIVRPLPVGAEDSKKGEPLVGEDASNDKNWAAKTQLGTPLTLTVNQNRIIGHARNIVLFSIPVRNVIGITHRTTGVRVPQRKLAEPWWSFWGGLEGAGGGSGDPGAAAAVIAGVFAVGGVLEGIDQIGKLAGKHQIHSVRIDWLENGGVSCETLEVDGLKLKSLLAELQKVTKKQWKDLPESIAKVRQELMRELPSSIPVELDRKARVGWVELKPGTYQLVPLERGSSRAELYLFPRNANNVKEVLAQALVIVERPGSLSRADHASASDIEYAEENGITTISRIRMRDRNFRFSIVPLAYPEKQ